MPVSEKPRKSRHRTPPKATTRRRESPLQRFFKILGISVVAVSLALVAVFSLQRKQQAAEQNDPNVRAQQTTSTVLEPPGGIQCPLPEGQPRRDAFPASGPPNCLVVGHTYKARITTDAGAFVVALDPTKAPRSVNTFVVLARYHFYDDLTFHKAVPGFFVQSGDPRKPGVTGPGFTFDDQLPAKGSYLKGSVAMANQRVGANGSQFLILVSDAPGLTPIYPLFGQVVEGLDVLTKIADDGGGNGEPKVVHRLLRVSIQETV
ncbi:MAG TPA: peptidylprolyl isomerase [Acidimicrobiales bacterium]|nr:peptidylprolyl isomerase [Acidimicrobiales bacterium]